MDFPELNLKGVLYCGYCYDSDEVAATSSYRLIHKSSGTYYYLDQRHEGHEEKRQTLPSWLVHRLIYRTLTYAHAHRGELLARHAKGVPYTIPYTAQDRLDAMMSNRLKAIAKLEIDEIEKLDDQIRLELNRQLLTYKRAVKILDFNPRFLEIDQAVPTSLEEFQKLAAETIPLILVYEDYISICTTFAVIFDYEIPPKPDKTNNVDDYNMKPFDMANAMIGAYLKNKYSKKPE